MKKFYVVIFSVTTVIIFVPAIIIFFFGGNLQNEFVNRKEIVSVLIDGEVKEFNLEKYLEGVLAGEMPAQFHEEALKAQAVAARTYIINKKKNRDDIHPQADVCADSTHCKAYLSDEQITEKFGKDWHEKYSEKIFLAVKNTEGEIAVYNGEPIEALFHSTGSGFTENAKDVWGGDVPYLVSVESPGDMNSPVFLNDVTISFEQFCSKVNNTAGTEISPYVGEIIRNDSGSVKTADLGGIVLTGTKIRELFSLPSANFTVTASDSEFTFHCKGKGHGVGMSQYGAEYFAKQGMNYKEILKKYYQGIDIVNLGELYDENNQD